MQVPIEYCIAMHYYLYLFSLLVTTSSAWSVMPEY